MATPEMLKSWEVTECHLRGALGLFLPEVASENCDSLAQVAEFLDHNELELAFDCMYSIASEEQWNSAALLGELALAASNIQLAEEARLLSSRVLVLQSLEQNQ